jgi:DNA end-binding protein Ku
MPRSIWTGSISFGLVNVPVRLFSAVEEHDLHFHLIHEEDESPVGYQKICKKEDRAVPDDEIVKGYEYAKGRYVYMTDEDFAAARIEGYKSIDVHDFVAYEDIDPIYFRHTYLVGPQDGAERVYALLVKAMEQSGLAGITKFIMRDRQNLGCLRVREGALTLEQMYFADEIRPLDEIRPGKVKVDRRELEMALQLIDRFSGDFDPSKYKDTYRDALRGVIDAKRKGKQIHVEAEVDEDAPADLMDALRASIQQSTNDNSRGDLEGKSKQQLLKLAQRAGVPGRSQMNKNQLVRALSSPR